MANVRFISRFTIGADGNKLRVNHSVDGDLDVEINTTDGVYYWSTDGGSDASGRDFAAELVAKLDAESSTVTWTAQVVGVNYTDPTQPQGAIRLSVSSGTFQVKWSDAYTTLDPRIMGEAEDNTTDKPAVAAAAYVSPFVGRYQWCPNVPVYDPDAITNNLVMSQAVTSAGYVDTVVIVSELELATYRCEYINAALVSLTCGEDDTRATSAGIAVDDPNASYEAWYTDCVTGQRMVRVYTDITAATAEDFDGPYYILLGGGVQHDSLGTASRPFPGGADLFNVQFDVLEAL